MSFIEDFNRRAEEERARQEARRREQEIQEAKNILSQYGEAAKRCGCSFTTYTLSYDQAKQVLRNKDEIRALASKISRLKNAVNGWFNYIEETDESIISLPFLIIIVYMVFLLFYNDFVCIFKCKNICH